MNYTLDKTKFQKTRYETMVFRIKERVSAKKAMENRDLVLDKDSNSLIVNENIDLSKEDEIIEFFNSCFEQPQEAFRFVINKIRPPEYKTIM